MSCSSGQTHDDGMLGIVQTWTTRWPSTGQRRLRCSRMRRPRRSSSPSLDIPRYSRPAKQVQSACIIAERLSYRNNRYHKLHPQSHQVLSLMFMSTKPRPLQRVRDLSFDWRYMMRGLVIDKMRGNILKIDRHKYVKLAQHGFQALTRDARLTTYNATAFRCGTAPATSGWHPSLFGAISCPHASISMKAASDPHVTCTFRLRMDPCANLHLQRRHKQGLPFFLHFHL